VSGTLTFFLPHKVSEIDVQVEGLKDDFDLLLQDLFTDDELDRWAPKLDEIAAIFVQPIMTELSFEDLIGDPVKAEDQKRFFDRCSSSIVLENLPFLESNPFQVTYLIELLKKFPDALIDRGGFFELMFKEDFLKEISVLKNLDSLLIKNEDKSRTAKTSAPVDPIDFLIKDVYFELQRLKDRLPPDEELSEKVKRLYSVMKEDRVDSDDLLRKTKLNAKDVDDGLERLKFWLRKHTN
jgi:hypothetical protein